VCVEAEVLMRENLPLHVLIHEKKSYHSLLELRIVEVPQPQKASNHYTFENDPLENEM
jgi:hypothetical protein